MTVEARAEPSESELRRRNRRIAIAACAGVILVGIGLVGLYRESRARRAMLSKGTFVLAEFRNTTGDPDFDGTLLHDLRVGLAQSPHLRILPDSRARSTLRLMGRSPGDALTPELAREVCERTGSSVVLTGSIAPLAKEYVVGLSAQTCGGELLDKEQEQTARKEDVPQMLLRIVSRFRKRAGE